MTVLLSGRTPIILVETRDEKRAVGIIQSVTSGPAAPLPAPTFHWTVTEGLTRIDTALGSSQRHNADPTEILRFIRDSANPGVYILVDFHPYLDEPVHVRLLKDIALSHEQNPRTIVLVSRTLHLPEDISHLAANFAISFPSAAERRQIVDRVVADWSRSINRQVQVDPRARDLLVENLSGLTHADTERLVRAAVVDDDAITESDLPGVTKAKHDLLAHGGVLSYEYQTVPLNEVGGMGRLKTWLQQRKAAFDGSAPGLDSPRGLLLLGVQGCGKSMAAKAAAHMLGVPLLRLDMGAVHDKYVGESERRLRDSLHNAELLSPCVLWIDEIEKAVASESADSGPSRRLLGTFLTWLAEKSAPVFVVATANDISALPPELVRKGRFDEIFFVDLPKADVRQEVLRIHSEKRGIHLPNEHLAHLAAVSDGFSGAELEQAVVSATYSAHTEGQQVNGQHVYNELQATRPLSVVMSERINQLRTWASSRTVPVE